MCVGVADSLAHSPGRSSGRGGARGRAPMKGWVNCALAATGLGGGEREGKRKWEKRKDKTIGWKGEKEIEEGNGEGEKEMEGKGEKVRKGRKSRKGERENR